MFYSIYYYRNDVKMRLYIPLCVLMVAIMATMIEARHAHIPPNRIERYKSKYILLFHYYFILLGSSVIEEYYHFIIVGVRDRVVRVVDLESLSLHRRGSNLAKDFGFFHVRKLSGTSMVLLRCPLVPEILQ